MDQLFHRAQNEETNYKKCILATGSYSFKTSTTDVLHGADVTILRPSVPHVFKTLVS